MVDSAFPLKGAQVQSLVGELRSHTPCCMANNNYYYYKYKVIKIACYIYLGLYKYLCATRRLERVLSEPVCSNLPEEHCMMIWNLGQQMPPLQTLGGVGPNSSYRR